MPTGKGDKLVFISHFKQFFSEYHSDKVRGSNMPMFASEILATTGLILTILFIRKSDESSVAMGVALFITAGYWFTSSTSFANPTP